MKFVKLHLPSKNSNPRVAYFRADRIAVVFTGLNGETCIALQNAVDGEEWSVCETTGEVIQRIHDALVES